MYDEEENIEEQKREDNICPQCGLRQYSSICANCNIEIEPEEDLDKKKEDEYDE
jgi:DNA-directed RNA polymerase subunit RPC12/RpoP